MKIAQYKYVDSNTTCIFPQAFERSALHDCVRVSEYVEVEFPPREPAPIVAETAMLREAKRAKLRQQLAELEQA